MTQIIKADIDILCGHCYEYLCLFTTQAEYEKDNNTCIHCGKRLLFILGAISENSSDVS